MVIKVGLIAGLLIVMGFAIGITLQVRFQALAKEREIMRGKYEEFIVEADQLAELTTVGVDKEDFARQLARAQAKWDTVTPIGFPEDSYGNYLLAMLKWKDVVRYWDYDSLQERVPEKMTDAADYYYLVKRTSQ